MSLSATASPKTYFIQRADTEIGPFTIAQLNNMRARNELTPADLCRAADSAELRPLAAVFPLMADFVNKTPEEHKQFARTIEGTWQANASFGCGIASFFIFGPWLAVFAMVLGIRASLRIRSIKAWSGTLLGAIVFTLYLVEFVRSYSH